MLVRPQFPLFVRSRLVVYRTYVLPPRIGMSKCLEGVPWRLLWNLPTGSRHVVFRHGESCCHRAGNIRGCSSGASYHLRLLVPNAGPGTTVSTTVPADEPGPWNIEGKYDVEPGSFEVRLGSSHAALANSISTITVVS